MTTEKNVNQQATLNDNLAKLVKGMRQISSILADFTKMVSSWQPDFVARQVTYEEAIEFFVKNQPKKFERAIMSRERRRFRHDYIFTQAYLDDKDELVKDSKGHVIGRRLIVDQLDEELNEVFGNKDVVIVE